MSTTDPVATTATHPPEACQRVPIDLADFLDGLPAADAATMPGELLIGASAWRCGLGCGNSGLVTWGLW